MVLYYKYSAESCRALKKLVESNRLKSKCLSTDVEVNLLFWQSPFDPQNIVFQEASPTPEKLVQWTWQLIAQANKDSKSTVSILRLNLQIRDCVCIQANCILNTFKSECLNSSSPTYSFDIPELYSVIILWMKSINMFPGSYKKAILQAVVFDIGKVFPDRLSSLSVQSQYSTKAFPKHYVVIAI